MNGSLNYRVLVKGKSHFQVGREKDNQTGKIRKMMFAASNPLDDKTTCTLTFSVLFLNIYNAPRNLRNRQLFCNKCLLATSGSNSILSPLVWFTKLVTYRALGKPGSITKDYQKILVNRAGHLWLKLDE